MAGPSSVCEATPVAAVTFTAAQAAVLAGALADAERYRRDLGAGLCADCAASSDGACQDHLEDLDRAEAYRGIAVELVHVLTKSAGRDVPAPRPASDLSRLGQERTMANTTTAASPQLPAVTCTRVFAGCPESVSAARSWVAGFFPGPGGGRRRADDQRTVHQRHPVLGLTASRRPGHGERRNDDGMVRVDVIDQGAMPPAWPLRTASAGPGDRRRARRRVRRRRRDRWFALLHGRCAVSRQAQPGRHAASADGRAVGAHVRPVGVAGLQGRPGADRDPRRRRERLARRRWRARTSPSGPRRRCRLVSPPSGGRTAALAVRGERPH